MAQIETGIKEVDPRHQLDIPRLERFVDEHLEDFDVRHLGAGVADRERLAQPTRGDFLDLDGKPGLVACLVPGHRGYA